MWELKKCRVVQLVKLHFIKVDICAQPPLGYPGGACDATLTYAADENLVHAREMAHGVFDAKRRPLPSCIYSPMERLKILAVGAMAKFFDPNPPIQNATFNRGR
jgi:hypothetical protein